MTVSVIVPCYNHAPYLRQRMESILGQTYRDFELILLDDCSTDCSREILEEYRNEPLVSHIVYNEANSGSPFAQWAKGIALAKGEWVWIAESDDYAEPTFIEEMVLAAQMHSPCSVIASTPVYLYADGSRWSRAADGSSRAFDGNVYIRQRLSVTNSLPNVSAMLIDRQALNHCDFTRAATMRCCGDWLLYVDMCRQGRVVELNRPLSVFRQHDDNTSLRSDAGGLSLIEGCDVLRHVVSLTRVPASTFRQWGKRWARMERQYLYPSSLRRRLRHIDWPSPLVTLWHDVYRIKYLCSHK